MNEQHITLDVSKQPATASVVHIRQGDKNGTVLAIDITDNGAPLDLAGLEATLVAKLPDGTLYEVDGTVSWNTATFEMDETDAAAAIGTTELAYVEITDTDMICSTQAFTLIAEPAGRSIQ